MGTLIDIQDALASLIGNYDFGYKFNFSANSTYSALNLFRNKAVPLILLAAFTVGYWPVLHSLSMRWNSGDNSYCYLVIPIFLYLCWKRRASFRFSEFSWSLWGLIPILFSVGLVLIGRLGSVETLDYMGIYGCVVGLTALLYGRRSRLLVFPLLVLFFIVPLPPFVNRMLTFKLKMAASSLSVAMLQAMGISVLQEGNIIDLGIDRLQVANACSGLRYFMPMVLLSLLIFLNFQSAIYIYKKYC